MDGVLTVLHLAPHPDDEVDRRRRDPPRAPARRPSRDQPRRHPGATRAGGAPASGRSRRRVRARRLRARGPRPLSRPHRRGGIPDRRAPRGRGSSSPSPHDGHHEHQRVGRAARDAVHARREATPPRLWLWGLWADLPWPTLYHGFDEPLMERAIHVPRGPPRASSSATTTALSCGQEPPRTVSWEPSASSAGEPRHRPSPTRSC